MIETVEKNMTTAATTTGQLGMTATATVGMAAGMTGADTGITKTATVTGFTHRHRSSTPRLQSQASGFSSHRSILIHEGRFTILLEKHKNERGQNYFPFVG